MITTSTLLVGTLALMIPPAEVPRGAGSGGPPLDDVLEARVWLDRGVDPVLQPGDQARIYYRVSQDAYVALFHIDTDGAVRLLAPQRPDEPHRVEAGQDYRLLFPGASRNWTVEEPPGVGYFFAVASRQPFDFASIQSSPLGAAADPAGNGARTYQGPHVIMDAAIEALVPGPVAEAFALDFTTYHVGEAYSYPRFLCYACHAAQPFEAWNPYHRTCRGYRVVIHNDPYYYPASRYRGERAVYPRPPDRGLPQFAFEERGQGDSGMPLVVNRSRVPGAAASRRGGSIGGAAGAEALPLLMDTLSPLNRTGPAAGLPRATSSREERPAGNRPVLQRRPSR